MLNFEFWRGGCWPPKLSAVWISGHKKGLCLHHWTTSYGTYTNTTQHPHSSVMGKSLCKYCKSPGANGTHFVVVSSGQPFQCISNEGTLFDRMVRDKKGNNIQGDLRFCEECAKDVSRPWMKEEVLLLDAAVAKHFPDNTSLAFEQLGVIWSLVANEVPGKLGILTTLSKIDRDTENTYFFCT